MYTKILEISNIWVNNIRRWNVSKVRIELKLNNEIEGLRISICFGIVSNEKKEWGRRYGIKFDNNQSMERAYSNVVKNSNGKWRN